VRGDAAREGDANDKADGRVAIDFVQEKVLGQGPQDNENALEQRKDEMISDCAFPPFLSFSFSFVPSLLRMEAAAAPTPNPRFGCKRTAGSRQAMRRVKQAQC
jgi:hypothetical protein